MFAGHVIELNRVLSGLFPDIAIACAICPVRPNRELGLSQSIWGDPQLVPRDGRGSLPLFATTL